MKKQKNENQKSAWGWLLKTYQFTSVNKHSLEEKKISTVKGIQVVLYLTSLFIFVFICSLLLIGYTPLKNLIPLAGITHKKEVIDLIVKVDSLERDLLLKRQYVNILNRIIEGEVVDSLLPISADTLMNFKSIDFTKSPADSILRSAVESEDLYNITNPTSSVLEDFVFFKPVEGVVTDSFNIREGHFGIDVAAHEGASVKSCLDGVVVFSDWSVSSGNVILIQHVDNIISVYMHNSSLTKKHNDLVKAGEVIGIVGNSGELSSGPHLHFELWQHGVAVNPEEYIDF